MTETLNSGRIDAGAYGDEYSLAGSESTDAAWARRQTIRRGKTKKIKLTNGNFVNEYPVPDPIVDAVEEKYRSTSTSLPIYTCNSIPQVGIDVH